MLVESLVVVAKCGLWDRFRDDGVFLFERLSQIAGSLSVNPHLGLLTQVLDLERAVAYYVPALPAWCSLVVLRAFHDRRNITVKRKGLRNSWFKRGDALAQEIVATIREPLLVLDCSLKVLTANHSFYDTFRTTPEETLGRYIYELGNRQWDIASLRKLLEDIIPQKSEFHDFEVEWDFPVIGRKVMLLNGRQVRRTSGEMAEMILLAIEDITERRRLEKERQQYIEKLQRMVDGVIDAIVFMVEVRDPYTAGHQRRVAELACAIAQELGLSEEKVEAIRFAAILHDIGKIAVPAEILSKPGKLDEIEMEHIKVHPQYGCDILRRIELPQLVYPIVLQHHERMNGSGYPNGLSDGDIILEARILAVADVVEAMSSHRPYRAALGIDKALEEIKEKKNILYDADVVDACLKLFTQKGFKFPVSV